MEQLFKKETSSGTRVSSGIDYNHYRLTPTDFIRELSFAVMMDALVSYTFYQSKLVFLLFFPVCLGFPFFRRKTLCEKRRHQLLLEFKESLSILSSFLSAGYSTENAFRASIPELRSLFSDKAMIVQEFEAIAHGLRLNRTIEELLSDFAYRSGLDDIANFAEIFTVAKNSGGRLVQIIQHTAGVIRDKVQIHEDILTMNASKRYEQKVMNMIPFGIILYMNFSSPEFLSTLYTTLLGRITMTGCLAVYILAIYLAERIMRIEV